MYFIVARQKKSRLDFFCLFFWTLLSLSSRIWNIVKGSHTVSAYQCFSNFSIEFNSTQRDIIKEWYFFFKHLEIIVYNGVFPIRTHCKSYFNFKMCSQFFFLTMKNQFEWFMCQKKSIHHWSVLLILQVRSAFSSN